MNKKFIYIMIISIISGLFSGCQMQSDSTTGYTSLSHFFFDTVVTITIYDDLENNSDIINQCFKLCDKYEKLFSKTISESDISRINNSKGNAVSVNSDTLSIIKDSIDYSKLTSGKFDITISPLTTLWNIDNNTGNIPDNSEIENMLQYVNYKNITIDSKIKLSDSNCSIDLGGIAKGYIADRLKEYMLSENIKSAIIDLGGNILTIGKKDTDNNFTIGIKRPFDEESNYIATLSINDKSVVTSGIYERYFEKNGKIYHHILDTKTGYPVENNLYSVTIISDKSEDGDALSTGVFALGLNNGMKLINSLDNIEAVFVTNENKLILSKGLKEDSNNQIWLK